MFVGEVRCATVGAGVSWKLSGGRSFSAAVTNVSKKLHVRRAMTRSSASCSGVPGSSIGWCSRLTRWATTGARNQSTAGTAATRRWTGPRRAATTSRRTGATRPPAITWTKRRSVPLACFCAAAAVVHSSRLRREKAIRQRVRAMASTIIHAWWARKVTVRTPIARPFPASCASACTWLRAVTPLRRRTSAGASGMSGGRMNEVTIRRSHARAPCAGSSATAARRPTTCSGATSERRRLSPIFHSASALSPSRRRRIHGSSCQSPRVHRCTRDAWTS